MDSAKYKGTLAFPIHDETHSEVTSKAQRRYQTEFPANPTLAFGRVMLHAQLNLNGLSEFVL